MTQKQFAFNRVILKITCADINNLMNLLVNNGIQFSDLTYCDDLTIQINTTGQYYKKIFLLAENQGISVKIVKRLGILWKINFAAKRSVILIFCIFVFVLSCFIQSRVLFLKVEGNNKIPDNQILECAQACGIRFGVSRRKIRSELTKNALLQKIPELQWAGINTSGCIAVISVREKTEAVDSERDTKQVGSIIASRDGIIQNCTVYQGNSLCSVGQAVKAGQLLVSGYTDCGIITKATQAKAEIQALTYRQLELITPNPQSIRGESRAQKTAYSIKIGKKVIKLTKDSGNYTDLCVKIYSEEYWQLPGGFLLPISIIKETSYVYHDDIKSTTYSASTDWLADFAKRYLQDIMVAGEVISAQTEIVQETASSRLYGKYTCLEMIGQTKVEQRILGEDTND